MAHAVCTWPLSLGQENPGLHGKEVAVVSGIYNGKGSSVKELSVISQVLALSAKRSKWQQHHD
jgi:hypothetical protein